MDQPTRRPRVFVTQPIAASALERLRTVADVTVDPDSSRILPRDALLAGVRDCDFLLSLMHDKIDHTILSANPNLRAIASMAVTPSDIDIEEATRRGIVVTTAPAIVTEATADICFGLLIAVARRIVEGDQLVRRGVFPGGQSNHLIGSGVWGKTLGLVGGGGRIGSAVARRARGFQMDVLYWSPQRKAHRVEQEIGVTFAPLDDLLQKSDFVSIHSPLKAETRHQIGERELALMKPTAFLINTARGPVVDELALVAALQRGQIAGAGLDVFEQEPAVAPALLRLANVVLTPHLGSAVAETRSALANAVVDNLLALIDGRRPPNIINPQVFSVRACNGDKTGAGGARDR
ncbi:MAG: D-glycerate dehydrogenase [Methylobacteriaceae bacterium]|nr:D-glycerate dehydrogenase [Methylobacteriaceae bacterium]